MKSCVAIRCIKASSAAIQRHHEAFDAELKTLLEFLNHEDVLVAYAAKEELWKVLIDDKITETSCANDIVRAIILTSTTDWRREASGFRFQLIRLLIHVKSGKQSTEGGSADEEGQLGCIVEHPYLQAVLKNLLQIGDMVRSVLVTADRSEGGVNPATAAPYSVQYEALVFLSEFVKQLHSLKIADRYQVELSEHMVTLMDDVFIAMDYVFQPTFVSCAVLGLLAGFQELLKFWSSQIQDDEYSCLRSVLSKWLELCLVWLLQSSCTSMALRLLHDNEHAAVTSQMAFIAESGRYPFLQRWLLYLSRMGTAYLKASLTQRQCAGKDTLQIPTLIGGPYCSTKQLLSRQQLFTVLAEQDDVMIEVLNGLMQMTILANYHSGSFSLLTQWCPSLAAYVTAEFDPDLFFADLVEILGRDHLVLLDLLVSNETQMLEYLVRYLRHLTTHWDASKQNLQACGRLESVMSVLIRLRLEIDRLVAADLFPYNAKPLVRRMKAIEQLYEEL
ncbi:unnamed protein product [Peronospora destructor]|uniref:Protein Lines N-terminal domain-containing protein n=1 Tax=Peronospora destructor TaxID=86335 RepID=A0AAV0TGK9_9STRA|nr:unnamed protein product [Peronospora destructor]